jgi:hypothetical protein
LELIFGLLQSLKIWALTKYFLALRSGRRKPGPVGGDGPRPPSHRSHAERKRGHIPHFRRRRGHVLLPTPGQIFRTVRPEKNHFFKIESCHKYCVLWVFYIHRKDQLSRLPKSEMKRRCLAVGPSACWYTVKKRLAIFTSTAAMSLTKLSLGGNN